MSHRKPSKTFFGDEWRDRAACRAAVKEDKSLRTAWDNIDEGTWAKENYQPDPQAAVAKQICYACPVRELCLKDAITDNQATGIRGGFRFENGYVDKFEARSIFNEFGLRAKVKKTRGSYGENEDTEEVSEVQSID